MSLIPAFFHSPTDLHTTIRNTPSKAFRNAYEGKPLSFAAYTNKPREGLANYLKGATYGNTTKEA